ncbi:MAG TPA: hypothetical protein VHR42_06525, partial [Clostridia bacterium]|nr:hypothetical protein [Clostridia bacterium]
MIEGKDHPLSLEEAAMETACSIVIKKRKKPVKTAKMLHRQLEVIREQYKKLIYSHDQITHA